jgi:hypothetical protein
MTEKPKREEQGGDTRTNEEILRELGFKPGDTVIDLSGSVEDISEQIVAGVRASLAAKGLSLEEMRTWTDETHPDPDQEADERACAEWAKKHGIGS